MNKIRKFEASDWSTYAGAEPLTPKQDPLILELELEFNFEASVIADRNGIEFYIGNGAEVESWHKDIELTPLRARAELEAIAKAVKDLTYAPDLVYELDHPIKEALKGFKSIGIVL